MHGEHLVVDGTEFKIVHGLEFKKDCYAHKNVCSIKMVSSW